MIPLSLFLLACAAAYVGTIETAFSALMRLSLRLLAERNGRGTQLGQYLDDPLRLFIPLRVVLGVIVALAAVLLARVIGVASLRSAVLLLASIVGFVIVCEHLIPLLIVRGNPERVLDVLLPSFASVTRGLAPVSAALARLFGLRRERGGPAVNASDVPAEEQAVQAYLQAGEDERIIEREERKLLQSIVDFGDTLVREVMTPRPDIVAIAAEATLGELIALIREQEYSRIPVYRENLDNILGFVFVKDLIQQPEAQSITALMRPAHFVPETKRVSELLKEFQRQQIQMAVVVDEYGGTAGLVTLEDLLEEIVGEIRDEYDVEIEPITDEGNGIFVFSGRVNVDEVVERLGVEIQPEGFETVGGYLLSHLGRVPAVGETFEIDGLTVEVLEAERRRIHKVRVRRGQPVEASRPADRQ